jgi:hypothetical protein
MEILSSKLNEALSGSLLNRIAADQFRIRAQASFWRLIGLGVLALGIGTGVGIAFWGYSRVTQNQDNITNMAAALTKALQDVQLHGNTTGAIQISPTEIALAKDQTITLDENSRVQLDPDAKVTAEGSLLIQAPTITVPRRVPSAPESNRPIITDFVVFKTVPFGDGTVSTGWRFLTSAQTRPTHQRCRYTDNFDAASVDVIITLGDDGVPSRPKQVPKGFDLSQAQSKCIWFK